MFLPLLVLVLSSYLLHLIDPARAQVYVNAPNCTVVSFSWSYNSLQQNPCLVAAYLAAACSNNNIFAIPPLRPGNSYTGPSGLDDTQGCTCNTVYYNLISACDACQGSSWIAYSEWTLHCTAANIGSAGTFPPPIAAGTRIPEWAYLDSSATDTWDLTGAHAAGDSPEVTGTASVFGQFQLSGGNITSFGQSQGSITSSATSASSSSTPTTTSLSRGSSSTPTSTSHSNSNTGGIAGGLVGGLVGAAFAALIVAVMAWFVIRRRSRSRQPVSSQLTVDQPPRFYDPSDPTTFPTFPYALSFPTNQSGQYNSPDLQLNRQAYNGLPDI
ncbi:hypothetical protein EI94DRAFT_1825404 [Lactarius quietus]|nr:hypothetical protein EI94DRAFT_1825404 [Lactarius quietus]